MALLDDPGVRYELYFGTSEKDDGTIPSLILVDRQVKLVWVYDEHTCRFHKSQVFFLDFYFDRDLNWVQCPIDKAIVYIREEHKYDLRSLRHIYQGHMEQPVDDTFTLEDVFGTSMESD